MAIEFSCGEIQNLMLEYGIKEPIVLAIKDEIKNSDKLLSFYLSGEDSTVDINDLKIFLAKTLPPYSIPQIFHEVEEYPYSANGKLDTNALIKLLKSHDEIQKDVLLPTTILEQKVYDVLKKYADSSFSIDDDVRNFIDSLDSIDVMLELIELGVIKYDDIIPQDVFDYPTVQSLVNRIENGIQIDMAKEICGIGRLDLESMKVLNKPYDADLSGVLLTGSTGFLGSHILHDLIKDKSVKKIYCLVRAKDNKPGAERLLSIYKEYFGEDISALIGSKIIPFEGDITSEHFNATPELYDELSNTVTTVINAAANVNHLGNRNALYRDNVASVQSLIKFCIKNNINLAHMSTASIGGSAVTEPVDFTENSFFENKQNIHGNAYLETKALAEFKVLEAMQKEGLNAKIFRLGNIMPRLSDGKFQLNDNENAFLTRLKAFSKLGAVPSDYLSSQEIELSPVDLCSNAIVKLLKTSYEQTIYHILNPNKLSLSKALERMEPKILSTEEFKKRVFSSKDKDVKFLMNYMHMISSEENRIVSDSTELKLRALGFSWNRYDIRYLKKILQLIKEDQDLQILLNKEIPEGR